jgi:alginate O-acetyltransferase complex protein AlgI
MVFNSLEFLLFGLLFFLLWPLFKKKDNPRWLYLVTASFLFYGWWDWRFLFLIIGSGLIDYFSGLWIGKFPKFRKQFLILSLIGNLGSLSIFKYSTFFATTLDSLFLKLGVQTNLVTNIPEFALILPVGISFYTFQSLSYTIDVYRDRLNPTRNILHFFSYLSMFPQLVAGPIVRAKDLLKQLAIVPTVNSIQVWNGIKLIVYGLFQKVVIADNLSSFIDSAFSGNGYYNGSLYWWVVMVAFAFQIYCDFSGYSLIARGLAKIMGYHFKMNFNHPYLSSSFKEFWGRWHISLSTWFRDYVYIPLGGGRKGIYKGVLFLWITLLLSGLWHGANITFIVWGAMHALFLTLERFYLKITLIRKVPKGVWIFVTFVQACIAWVFFRADSMGQSIIVLKSMFNFQSTDINFFITYFDTMIFLGLAIVIEMTILLKRNKINVQIFYKRSNLDLLFIAIAIVAIVMFRGEGKQFIYFQF